NRENAVLAGSYDEQFIALKIQWPQGGQVPPPVLLIWQALMPLFLRVFQSPQVAKNATGNQARRFLFAPAFRSQTVEINFQHRVAARVHLNAIPGIVRIKPVSPFPVVGQPIAVGIEWRGRSL